MRKSKKVRTIIKAKFPRLIRLFNKFHLREDRRILERIIFPYLTSREEFYKVLFVGCDWYTKVYETYFKKKEYWTIEIDPNKSIYGSKKHITDSLLNIDLYFADNYFDLIICNGVFVIGGIDDRKDAEIAFTKCFRCLCSSGVFVLGWNDIPELRPFPVQECYSLSKFKPYIFPPLSTSHYLTNTPLKHTYDFYIKPD